MSQCDWVKMRCWFSFSFPRFLNIYISIWLSSSSLVDINLCSLVPIKSVGNGNQFIFHVWKGEVVVLRFNTSVGFLMRNPDGPCPWSWLPLFLYTLKMQTANQIEQFSTPCHSVVLSHSNLTHTVWTEQVWWLSLLFTKGEIRPCFELEACHCGWCTGCLQLNWRGYFVAYLVFRIYFLLLQQVTGPPHISRVNPMLNYQSSRVSSESRVYFCFTVIVHHIPDQHEVLAEDEWLLESFYNTFLPPFYCLGNY